MGPVLTAQSKLEKEIKAGKKQAGRDACRPTSSRRPTPSTATRLRSADRLQGRDWSRQKHVVKVTVGFNDEVRDDFLSGTRSSGPGPRSGPDRLRRSPPGLRPAPRRRPRLLRDRPVPLAVPATERESLVHAPHAALRPTRTRPDNRPSLEPPDWSPPMNLLEENRRPGRGVRGRSAITLARSASSAQRPGRASRADADAGPRRRPPSIGSRSPTSPRSAKA